MRTASSSVNSWRSRTQCASRCVWIEQSDIWLTCAPESEKPIDRVRVRAAALDCSSWSNGANGLHEELVEVGLERRSIISLDRVDAAASARHLGDRRVRRHRRSSTRIAVEVGRPGLAAERARRTGRRRPTCTAAATTSGSRELAPLLVDGQARGARCHSGRRSNGQLASGTTTCVPMPRGWVTPEHARRRRAAMSSRSAQRTVVRRPWRRRRRARRCSTASVDEHQRRARPSPSGGGGSCDASGRCRRRARPATSTSARDLVPRREARRDRPVVGRLVVRRCATS